MADAVAPTIPSTTAPLLDPMAMLGGAQPHIAPQSPVDFLAALQDFRTGFFVLDMLLCLLVPILIQQLLTLMQNGGDGSLTLFAPILAWFWPKDDDDAVERTIEITQRFNRDGHKVWDYEQKNHLLQKAISLYLSDVLNLENKDAKYELLEKPRSKDEDKRNDSANENEDDGSVTSASSAYDSDDEDEDGYDYTGIAKLSVEALPMINTWIEVEKGILFKHEVITPENPGERKGVTETKVVFRFSSTLPDGSDRIDAFIDKAYTNYQESERRKVKEDNSRYFYIQSGSKASSSDANKQVVAYKRYALGEEKTFENLFFDEKAQVMQLLDNFANKTGKFGIKGFPYKLGFLLHGPPGTGKTSLIKAIAQYTKRHLVTINLGKIKSNQELMDAIFDLKFAVQGLDSPVEYSFEDVIFVMEDIDCASSIVNKRDGDEEEEKDEAAATENDKKEGGQDEETKESEDVAEKEKVEETTKTKKASKDDFKSDDEKFMSMMLKLVMEDDKKHAKLNLAGLLNVLDGVIDCPGRIIIMTSNHPEKLDPALVRPGRVNKKLLLSYMNATQVQQMIEYYTMTSLTDAHAARLEAVFAQSPNRVSPAQVEEMCAEFDSTDAILDAMERLASV